MTVLSSRNADMASLQSQELCKVQMLLFKFTPTFILQVRNT